MRLRLAPALMLIAALGCEKKTEPQSKTATSAARIPPQSTGGVEQPTAEESPTSKTEPASPQKATIGEQAPDFSLPNLDGETVRLGDFEGKRIVLEWFNPECPFVNLAHTKGSLKGLAKKYEDKGVVWLAINSGAEGRQGHGVEANRARREKLGFDYPILLDESGRVGHAYGATNTPHMFVIDEEGVLVYTGAIDNSPDAEGESPAGGTLINYVDAAMSALDANRPVETPQTEAYGCSVKYAKK